MIASLVDDLFKTGCLCTEKERYGCPHSAVGDDCVAGAECSGDDRIRAEQLHMAPDVGSEPKSDAYDDQKLARKLEERVEHRWRGRVVETRRVAGLVKTSCRRY